MAGHTGQILKNGSAYIRKTQYQIWFMERTQPAGPWHQDSMLCSPVARRVITACQTGTKTTEPSPNTAVAPIDPGLGAIYHPLQLAGWPVLVINLALFGVAGLVMGADGG
jgi:hypothetical protein